MERRRNTKRILVALGGLVVLFMLLHTAPAKELARRIVVRVASSILEGPVSVGALDYQLWRGVVELDDVALEPDLMVLPFAFTADRLEVELAWPSKLSATLERPELVFIDFFDTPMTDYTPMLAYIEKLEVEDGAIRFQDHGEHGELAEWIATEGVTIDLFDTGDEHRAAVHFRGGHAYEITFGAIDADLLLSPGHLRAASASVFKDDSFVRATGELDFSGELEGDLDLEFALDGALARLLNDLIDEELDVAGVVTGRTRVDFIDGSYTIDAALESESLAWESVLAENIEAEASYVSGKLTLRRLEARGYGGRARLGAEITFDEDTRNRFELSWASIDAGALASIAGESFPFASRISGDATLTLTGFDFESASGGARVELVPGSDILGTVEVSLDSEIVEIKTRDVSLPELGASIGVDGTVTTSGQMELDVDVAFQDVATAVENPPVPIAGALSARGHLSGPIDDPQWWATLASDGLRIRGDRYDLIGDVTGSAQSVSLNGVRLESEIISLTTEGSVPLSHSGAWNLDISLDGIAEGTVAVFGAADDPDWSANLELKPAEGSYALVVHKSGRRIHVDELTGSLATTSLEGRGSYDLDSESAEGTLSVSNFRPSELEATREYLHGFDGVVAVDANISGPWRSPNGRAEVRVQELTYDSAELPSLNLSLITIDGADETLRLQVSRDDGARLMTGNVELSESYPLHAEIALDALPISEILNTIPVFLDRERAVWTASGTAVIDVPLTEPSALVFRTDVDSLEARFSNASARASSFTFAGDLDGVRIDGFELRGDENRLLVDGFIPMSADAPFELEGEADLDLAFLRILEPDLEVSGKAVIQGSVRGTLEQLEFEGSVNIDDGAGNWNALSWSELTLTATAEEDRLSEIALDANVLGGRVEMDGAIPLLESAGAGRLEFRVVDVDLMPDDRDGTNRVGIVSIAGAVDLLSPNPETWSGLGSLDRLSVRAAETGVDLAAPAVWRLADGVLSMPDVRVEGDRSRLDLNLASLGFTDGLVLDATARGVFDIALLNTLFDSGGTRVDGLLELEAAARHVDGELDVNARATLSDARLAMVDPRFVLSDVSATLILDGAVLTVSELSARAGSGSLSGDGTVDLSVLSRPVFDLHASADGVPLEIMDGLRAEVSGGLNLESTPAEPAEPAEDDELRLSGNLAIDRGLLTRELDDEDNDFSAHAVVLSDPTAEPGPLDELVLNVVIATARNIRIENSTAQLEVAGSISVGGTMAAPDFGGGITLQRDGSFNIGRNKFQVVQGRIDLTGFPLVPPNIQLSAVTKVGSTVINVDLEGDADDMRTSLTAPESPELTEGDLASLIMTGRTLENASEGGQQMASTWMMSSLANLAHDGLGDLISFGPAQGAGPLILAEEADPTARLTLGYPVTERLSVTYSIALDSTERRLWILDYRVARNVWLRGIQENSNDYSLGLSQRFSLDFRERPVAARAAAREQSIARVQIEGAPSGVAERVKIQAGDRYDYWATRDEALKMEKSLVKSGYRSAVVDVDAEVDESGQKDAVALRFIVHTGKATEFVWRGDDPSKDVKNMVARAWAGRIPEDFLLADVERRATAELRGERYYTARIDTSIDELEDRRNIVFDVTRGPRGKEVRLTFDGNASLSDEDLREALPKTDTPELFLLLDQRAELERGMRLRYAADGYLDVRIGAVETSYDTESKVFHIEIPVDEGPQSEIASVSFDGELTFDSEKLSKELGVEPGTPVDFPEIRRGQTRLRTLYRNEGFPDVKVRAELERTAEGLDIVVDIDEGARARVGVVRIVGNLRTHPNVIRNELTFESNDPVRIIDFQETQKRLYDLGIFRSADVRPDPTQQGQEVQDIVIQLVERADLDVNYGLRYNIIGSEQSVSSETEPQSSGLEVVSRINFVNQMGRGTNFGLSIFFQNKYQLYRATFRIPTFFGRRIVTELFADTERDEERLGIENFETRSESVTFQQTKKLTDNRHEKFALQWNVRFGRGRSRRFDKNNVLRAIDTNRPRFGTSLIEDRRDSFANPTRGRFWAITVQAVPEIWGSDVSYVRLFGQFFYYYPLAKSVVWASGVRMGFTRGTRELLLMEDRFLAGGANSVRGFKQNSLGPSVFIEETQERFFVGGQAVAVYNHELRFPVYKALHGGVYWDAGNVFGLAKQFRLSDLRHSVGAGLRFVLPFGAIRFDWAEALNAQPTDETTRFHFSFGYAF